MNFWVRKSGVWFQQRDSAEGEQLFGNCDIELVAAGGGTDTGPKKPDST